MPKQTIINPVMQSLVCDFIDNIEMRAASKAYFTNTIGCKYRTRKYHYIIEKLSNTTYLIRIAGYEKQYQLDTTYHHVRGFVKI